MDRISTIELPPPLRSKQLAREQIGFTYDPRQRLDSLPHLGLALERVSVRDLDRKVKHGQNLTFEEAFVGMCYVLAATNARFYVAYQAKLAQAYSAEKLDPLQAIAIGTAFMQLMAAKEALSRLTPDEVAGMAAAALLDTVFQLDLPTGLVETCGMGGDRGLAEGKKTINASTLSAFVLASLRVPTMKHGSYKNTSAVGSTDSIEKLGANVGYRRLEDVAAHLADLSFCFTDAHLCKTIHDLSHLLKMETVNHVVGPMSPPITGRTPICKLMGVNEKVHPATVAQAYAILHRRGIQINRCVAVIGGLDQVDSSFDPVHDLVGFSAHCALDEVSPFSTVVAITRGAKLEGTWLLQPADFGLDDFDPNSMLFENTEEALTAANLAAIRGESGALADYLAMNAAVALFTHESQPGMPLVNGNGLLAHCFKRCSAAIADGSAWRALDGYIAATNCDEVES